MQKYSRVFYLVGFLAMPVFILLLVFGYIKINQMASEEIHWGHNKSFAFGQASREGKLILLAVTKSRCEMLRGLECGEGKPDLGTYVLLNFTPATTNSKLSSSMTDLPHSKMNLSHNTFYSMPQVKSGTLPNNSQVLRRCKNSLEKSLLPKN